MSTILIIEDKPAERLVYRRFLEKSGYTVIEAENGMKGIEQAQSKQPDLILLDIDLPDVDGKKVCERLREKDSTRGIPIFMFTAYSKEKTDIQCLKIGADGFLSKREPKERFLAHIEAILRRQNGGVRKILKCGNVTIDQSDYKVYVDDQLVSDITRKEFYLLLQLAKNRGVVVKRESLISNVWKDDSLRKSRTLDVHINSLKKKLSSSDLNIESERGIGYRISK